MRPKHYKKLSYGIVLLIKKDLASGQYFQNAIAEKYKTSTMNVSAIKNGKTWKSVKIN